MSLLTNLIAPATQLLDKFIEDKDQKAKLAHELATMADKMAHDERLAQISVNKEEASSKVSGRPTSIQYSCKGKTAILLFIFFEACKSVGISVISFLNNKSKILGSII